MSGLLMATLGISAIVALRRGSVPLAAGRPTPPTRAEAQQAFAAAHSLPRALAGFLHGHEAIYFSLGASQNILCALDDGEASVALLVGRTAYDLRLEQTNPTGSNYKFTAYAGARVVGSFRFETDFDADSVCYLTVGRELNPALAGFQQDKFWLLSAPTFTAAVRHALATSPREAQLGYYAAQTLNDKGYFLQQLGHPREACLFFEEVLRRYPSRAVAYLNRGDAHWTLGRPARAQADYRQYLALLRTQHKDTTRVPAYVRLVLRLPAST
ncbi:MAG: tetratricopeptide repeat protein [Janthinobacterium lividum]